MTQINIGAVSGKLNEKIRRKMSKISKLPYHEIIKSRHFKSLLTWNLKVLINLQLNGQGPENFIQFIVGFKLYQREVGSCMGPKKLEADIINQFIAFPSQKIKSRVQEELQKTPVYQLRKKDEYQACSEAVAKLQLAEKAYATPQSFNNQNFTHLKKRCLSCIGQFHEDQPIPNTGQPFTMVSRSKYNEEIVVQKLKSKICGLLNCGGGYLYISEKEEGLASGAEYLNGQAQTWNDYLKSIISSIIPQCFTVTTSEASVKPQYQSYGPPKAMIKVTVIPNSKRFVYCVMKKIENLRPSFYFYFLDFRCQNKANDILKLNNLTQVYDIIFQKYATEMKLAKQIASCYPISTSKASTSKCVRPLTKEEEQCLRNLLGEVCTQDQTVVKTKKKKILQIVKDSQIHIAHKHQSILILSNENQDYFIKQIERILSDNKLYQYKFVKPYTSYRGDSIKSIWFVSHEFPLEVLRSYSDRAQKQSKSVRVMAWITCTKYIKVEWQTPDKFTSYITAFQKLFQRQLRWVKKKMPNESELYEFFFKYDSFQQSTFSFIYLDNLRIRCVFQKEKDYENFVKSISVA